jgi:hypothetical protein
MVWTTIEIFKTFFTILTFALSIMITYVTFTEVKLMAQKKKNSFIRLFMFVMFDSTLAMAQSCANFYHSFGFKSDKKTEMISVLTVQVSRTLATPILFFIIHDGVRRQLSTKKNERRQPNIISSSRYTIDTTSATNSDAAQSDDQLEMNVIVHSVSFDLLNGPRSTKNIRNISEDMSNMPRVRSSTNVRRGDSFNISRSGSVKNSGKSNQKDYRGTVLLSDQFKAALSSTKMRNDSSNDSLPY